MCVSVEGLELRLLSQPGDTLPAVLTHSAEGQAGPQSRAHIEPPAKCRYGRKKETLRQFVVNAEY